ncbi:MAG: hypothetical protein NUW06_08345 [Candidatus Acetothermia bacterium]|jgi:hypothetical protein|nr:hypothetical protein [Candidatus Acetothermia bacterium]MDH7506118.1 hypothetical protein [Candidatus Acetothermia bacterium]
MAEKLMEAPSVHKISAKGQRILDSLPEKVVKEHFGQFIAIEVDSGDYFTGDTAIEATQKARAKHPDKIFFLGRIGYRTAYTFKGRR